MHAIVKSSSRRISFIPDASSVCASFVALHTSRQYSTSCQHFAVKADQFLQLLFIFDPEVVQGYWH
jgi:hypothetical protein